MQSINDKRPSTSLFHDVTCEKQIIGPNFWLSYSPCRRYAPITNQVAFIIRCSFCVHVCIYIYIVVFCNMYCNLPCIVKFIVKLYS